MIQQLKAAFQKFILVTCVASPAFADASGLRYARDYEILQELDQRFRAAGHYDNQQLLGEIQARLRGQSGGGGATITYNCNARGNMNIAAVSPAARETVVGVNMYDINYCEMQAGILNAFKARADSNIVIAICNSNANLQRFSISTAGTVSALSTLNVGDRDRCLNQAASINQIGGINQI